MSIPSYEKINFLLRPAKNIERKLIVEVLSRLRVFYALDTYRYIGFGSPYFPDFSIVHRTLGIQDMICIEKETGDASRFEFNRPFSCIQLEFGESTAILPTLEWRERPTIIWMDYDDAISKNVISDIDIICSTIEAGSFILISLRAVADDFGKDPKERLEQLTEVLGEKMPAGVASTDGTPLSFSNLIWRILDAEIRYILAERSAGLGRNRGFQYEQLLHFNYRDGIPMVTIGGAIYQEGQRTHIAQCDFASLPYVKTGNEPYKITVPKLTFREMRALDAQLPGTTPSLPGVRISDIQAYAKHYRYFPNYVEAEF